jgi:uncharacterized protein YndB with AHSA1/START domain
MSNKTIFIAEPGKQEVTYTRIFNAPRDRVFKATTDPLAIPKWWGPREMKTVVDKMDAKPGGMWRFVQTDAKGGIFAFNGVYHEVTPERIVQTFEYEGMPGHTTFEVGTLEELPNGTTKFSGKTIFQSVEDRDQMVKYQMEFGLTESHDRLEELLQSPS